MSFNQVLGLLRKADERFSMIGDGDKVCVGLSGGKDSLALLQLLDTYRAFAPHKFELGAITIDMGFKDADFSAVKNYCDGKNIAYHIEKTDIGPLIFDVRKEKNPCSLCSRMRRGALVGAAAKLGYNKIALGHHADDLIETLFLSMFYEGRLSVFSPIAHMDRRGITLIRPLILAKEKDLIPIARALPVCPSPCPANHATRREYVKTLIKGICRDIPFAKDRIISAITHPERNNLWPPQ